MSLIKDYLLILKKKWKICLVIILVVTLYLLIHELFFKEYPSCLIKLIFGYPCPGCGLTRAYLSFFHLDFKNAFYYHPLFLLVPILVFGFIFMERPFWSKLYHSKIFWTIIILLITITYILRMIYIFPNEPMAPFIKN